MRPPSGSRLPPARHLRHGCARRQSRCSATLPLPHSAATSSLTGAPMWPAPPAPAAAAAGSNSHRVRNDAWLELPLAVLGAGIGIGHHVERPKHHAGFQPDIRRRTCSLELQAPTRPEAPVPRTAPSAMAHRSETPSATREAATAQATAARGIIELVGRPERRQRHRVKGRPRARRHQHDPGLPAGTPGGGNGHRARPTA